MFFWERWAFGERERVPSLCSPSPFAARAITDRGARRRIGRVLRHSLPAAPQRQQRITGGVSLPPSDILIRGAEEQKRPSASFGHITKRGCERLLSTFLSLHIRNDRPNVADILVLPLALWENSPREFLAPDGRRMGVESAGTWMAQCR